MWGTQRGVARPTEGADTGSASGEVAPTSYGAAGDHVFSSARLLDNVIDTSVEQVMQQRTSGSDVMSVNDGLPQ